jgi:hypothetical protein
VTVVDFLDRVVEVTGAARLPPVVQPEDDTGRSR